MERRHCVERQGRTAIKSLRSTIRYASSWAGTQRWLCQSSS